MYTKIKKSTISYIQGKTLCKTCNLDKKEYLLKKYYKLVKYIVFIYWEI